MSGELHPEEDTLIGTNRGRTTGMLFGGQRAGLVVLFEIAFDGGEADTKEASDLRLGVPGGDGCHDLGAEVGEYAFTPQSVKKSNHSARRSTQRLPPESWRFDQDCAPGELAFRRGPDGASLRGDQSWACHGHPLTTATNPTVPMA